MQLRKQIELKGGVRVDVLCTPRLYRVAKQKGIEISVNESTSSTDVYAAYIDMLYCAAVNAWEVDSIDDPAKGDFPHTYADFTTTLWETVQEDPKKFIGYIDFMLTAMTGKGVSSYASEVKKKRKSEGRSK